MKNRLLCLSLIITVFLAYSCPFVVHAETEIGSLGANVIKTGLNFWDHLFANLGYVVSDDSLTEWVASVKDTYDDTLSFVDVHASGLGLSTRSEVSYDVFCDAIRNWAGSNGSKVSDLFISPENEILYYCYVYSAPWDKYSKLIAAGASPEQALAYLRDDVDFLVNGMSSSAVSGAKDSLQNYLDAKWEYVWADSIDVTKIFTSDFYNNNSEHRNRLFDIVQDAAEDGHELVFSGHLAKYNLYGPSEYRFLWYFGDADSSDIFAVCRSGGPSSGTCFPYSYSRNCYVASFYGSSRSAMGDLNSADTTYQNMINARSDIPFDCSGRFGSLDGAVYPSWSFRYVDKAGYELDGVFSIGSYKYLIFSSVSALCNYIEGKPVGYYVSNVTTYDCSSGDAYTWDNSVVNSSSYTPTYEYITNVSQGDTYNGISMTEVYKLIDAVLSHWDGISSGDGDLSITKNENTVTNEDGSTSTTYNYTYNYYTNPDSTPDVPSDGGGSSSGSGGSSSDGSSSGVWSLLSSTLKGLGEAIGGLIAGAASLITGLITSITSALASVNDFSGVSDWLADTTSFIPPAIWSLIFAGISACVVISIFKAFRG